jgi:hypothetical protein
LGLRDWDGIESSLPGTVLHHWPLQHGGLRLISSRQARIQQGPCRTDLILDSRIRFARFGIV